MNEPTHQFDLPEEAYLDDLLDAEQKREVEQAHGESLRSASAQQASIDASLRRIFTTSGAAPTLVELRERIAVMSEAQDASDDEHDAVNLMSPRYALSQRPLVRTLLLAAAVLMLAVGAWQIWTFIAPGGSSYQTPEWKSLQAIYREEIERGFDPHWVCESPKQFSDTFARAYGQPLQIPDNAEMPEGVRSLGLAYANSLSTNTTYLLARVEEQPVVVFIDRIEKDRPTPPTDPSLHLYRRTIGPLVLYELSPLDEPRVLDLFFIPGPGGT